MVHWLRTNKVSTVSKLEEEGSTYL